MAIKSPFFDSELALFVCDDEEKLKALPQYQQVRTEINRKFTPLAGRIDWQKVDHLVTEMGQTQGVDLLLSTYFCVARTRLSGLTGLTNGLELLCFALSCRWQEWGLPENRRAELVNWMVARCIDEIKGLKPDISQLRLLYRCERALADMMTQFERAGVAPPNLDSIGYWVFEAIDRIEHPGKAAKAEATPAPAPVILPRRRVWPMFISGLLAGLLFVIPASLIEREEVQFQDHLLSPKSGPLALSKQEIKNVISLHSEQDMQRGKDLVTAHYQARISSLLEEQNQSNLHHAEQLASAVSFLYPEDNDLKRNLYKVKYKQQEAIDLLNNNYQRFASARRSLANLKVAVDKLPEKHKNEQVQRIRRLAAPSYSYAIGLSPVIARLWYLDDLLDKGELDKASREMDKLEQTLAGVNLKLARLKQVYEMQRLTQKADADHNAGIPQTGQEIAR